MKGSRMRMCLICCIRVSVNGGATKNSKSKALRACRSASSTFSLILESE